MPRATDVQKVERLNLARDLLGRKQPFDAASELAQTCSISLRQAYRYVSRAQRERGPLPVTEPKVAFTVKLSRALVHRLREYASSTGLTLSEVVSQALQMFLNRGSRGGGRSEEW